MTHKNPDMIINGIRISALAEEKQQDDKRVGELLPCPFCGSDAIRWREHRDGNLYYAVVCTVENPACYCSHAPESALWDTQGNADMAWNTRTITEQAVVEAVEGLIDIEGEKHGYITDKIRNEHFTEAIAAIRKVFNPTGEKK